MILRSPRSTLFPYTTLFFFFFNDTATTEIYTLSLHDALPICGGRCAMARAPRRRPCLLGAAGSRSEEHTSELQSHSDLVCRLLLENKKHTSELQSHSDIVCRLLLEKKTHVPAIQACDETYIPV